VNVDDAGALRRVVDALGTLAQVCPLVFPVHPRTRARLADLRVPSDLRLIEPLGYLDFIALQASARLVLTDSGGVQEETTVLGVPCLTLRDTTERPVTVREGTNTVVGRDPDRIVATGRSVLRDGVEARRPALWDGRAGPRVADAILAAGRERRGPATRHRTVV
jgi:UDP-N-acetylglucosamine 2-epimerase (non-hydrolysing)